METHVVIHKRLETSGLRTLCTYETQLVYRRKLRVDEISQSIQQTYLLMAEGMEFPSPEEANFKQSHVKFATSETILFVWLKWGSLFSTVKQHLKSPCHLLTHKRVPPAPF